MDMSCANQAPSAEYLVEKQGQARDRRALCRPEVDREIASVSCRFAGMSTNVTRTDRVHDDLGKNGT